jgi:outer membrane protein assembly factor BamB
MDSAPSGVPVTEYEPRLATPDVATHRALRVRAAENPLEGGSLGAFAGGLRVDGPDHFPATLVLLPYNREHLRGIDGPTVRMFRVGDTSYEVVPLWRSGVNLAHSFVWAEITEPGLFVPVGLPRDRLLLSLVLGLARRRALHGAGGNAALLREAFAPLLSAPETTIQQVRYQLTRLELRTSSTVDPGDVRRGARGGLAPFDLPGGVSLSELKARIERLEPGRHRLPEEALLAPPSEPADGSPPWRIEPGDRAERALRSMRQAIAGTAGLDRLASAVPWLSPSDWWMYHADEHHSGNTHGGSAIWSATVAILLPLPKIQLGGRIASVPAIVQGKIYVGTWSHSDGGALYRVDLRSGQVEHSFRLSGELSNCVWGSGIGSTPAVVDGKVYFATVDARAYRVDASTMALDWMTDLTFPDVDSDDPYFGKNQPCDNSNPPVACWTSPLVVNGKVFVGVGLGENDNCKSQHPAAFGFVYCLDAESGRVRWIFWTNKYPGSEHNEPNVLPRSAVFSEFDPPPPPGVPRPPREKLPPWFEVRDDSHVNRGASVWSSPVYLASTNRVYVATGNPNPDHPLRGRGDPPEDLYSTCVLSLDADTGKLAAYFQPTADDSYRPDDDDVDFAASPTLFRHQDQWVLGIGCKNGSYFLLDPVDLHVIAKRQLLPYYDDPATSLPDPNRQIPTVDVHHGDEHENHSGPYSCAAVHEATGSLFVGLGGWQNAERGHDSAIDSSMTPFLRALDRTTLADRWPTAVVDGVTRYQIPGATPLYATKGEIGLSSPAIVNDLVFMATNKPALYAFHAATGVCLWESQDLLACGPCHPLTDLTAVIGPAIYGDFVVIGSGNALHVYTPALGPPPPTE